MSQELKPYVRNEQAAMSNQSGTQAVDRAARLLAEVVHSSDPVTFTGLSAATGLAQPTTGPLERRTDKTITSEAALRTDLATVRARGYAVTDEELEPGLIAVAAPIRGYDGAVIAALSVSGPTTRMNRDGLPAVAGYCAEEAAALSAVLGYRQRGIRQSRKAGAA